MYFWTGSCVAGHIVPSGSQPGFLLVLCALQARRELLWATSRRHVLRVGTPDCERTGVRVRRNDGSTPHAAFWIARDGDKSAERVICHGGDKRPGTIHSRSYARPVFGCRSRDRYARNTMGVHALKALAGTPRRTAGNSISGPNPWSARFPADPEDVQTRPAFLGPPRNRILQSCVS